MKKEFTTKPSIITETWPGELSMFAWQEFVASIPAPLFVATSYKANGKPNACLQSWAGFASDSGQFTCILGWVNIHGHFYKTLKETGCCVLNFPSGELVDKCYDTIEHNQYDADEITASGMTVEKAAHVNAPRIAECFLNIECELLWEKQNFQGSDNVVVALKAVHFGMDSNRYDHSKLGRHGETGYVMYTSELINPETGKREQVKYGTIQPH